MPLFSNLVIRHKGCRGLVTQDPTHKLYKTCERCSRSWNLWSALFTTEFYSLKHERKQAKYRRKKERKLTGNPIADALPYWPRWARITSTASLLIGIGVVIYYAF